MIKSASQMAIDTKGNVGIVFADSETALKAARRVATVKHDISYLAAQRPRSRRYFLLHTNKRNVTDELVRDLLEIDGIFLYSKVGKLSNQPPPQS